MSIVSGSILRVVPFACSVSHLSLLLPFVKTLSCEGFSISVSLFVLAQRFGDTDPPWEMCKYLSGAL